MQTFWMMNFLGHFKNFAAYEDNGYFVIILELIAFVSAIRDGAEKYSGISSIRLLMPNYEIGFKLKSKY